MTRSQLGDELNALTAFFAGVNEIGIVAAYLFGSRTTGTAHRESDVDVAVLLDYTTYPTPRARFERRVTLTTELIDALHLDAVDVVVLNDVPPGFARRILREGVRAYCSDTAAERAFVRDTELKACDLTPFLDRTRRIKLASLAR